MMDELYQARYELAKEFLMDWLTTEVMNTEGDDVLEYLRNENSAFVELDYDDQCYLSDVIVDVARHAIIEVTV